MFHAILLPKRGVYSRNSLQIPSVIFRIFFNIEEIIRINKINSIIFKINIDKPHYMRYNRFIKTNNYSKKERYSPLRA